MPSRSGSSFSDDMSNSSQWTTTYRKLPKKQATAIRFMSWAAGAPRGATVVKKRTRDVPDDQSVMSGWSSGSYWSEADTQLFWVTSSEDRHYSGSSSSSGRSSRSSRSSRKSHGSGRKGSSRGKHFDGVPPPQPMMPPPPGHEFDHPMGGHYPPPPPPGDMDGHYGGGGFPPPMQPVNPGPPAGGQPAFFDLSGQQGFNRGGPHGYHNPEANDDYWSESGSDVSSMTS